MTLSTLGAQARKRVVANTKKRVRARVVNAAVSMVRGAVRHQQSPTRPRESSAIATKSATPLDNFTDWFYLRDEVTLKDDDGASPADSLAYTEFDLTAAADGEPTLSEKGLGETVHNALYRPLTPKKPKQSFGQKLRKTFALRKPRNVTSGEANAKINRALHLLSLNDMFKERRGMSAKAKGTPPKKVAGKPGKKAKVPGKVSGGKGEYEEQKHPRAPKGAPTGGQWSEGMNVPAPAQGLKPPAAPPAAPPPTPPATPPPPSAPGAPPTPVGPKPERTDVDFNDNSPMRPLEAISADLMQIYNDPTKTKPEDLDRVLGEWETAVKLQEIASGGGPHAQWAQERLGGKAVTGEAAQNDLWVKQQEIKIRHAKTAAAQRVTAQQKAEQSAAILSAQGGDKTQAGQAYYQETLKPDFQQSFVDSAKKMESGRQALEVGTAKQSIKVSRTVQMLKGIEKQVKAWDGTERDSLTYNQLAEAHISNSALHGVAVAFDIKVPDVPPMGTEDQLGESWDAQIRYAENLHSAFEERLNTVQEEAKNAAKAQKEAERAVKAAKAKAERDEIRRAERAAKQAAEKAMRSNNHNVLLQYGTMMLRRLMYYQAQRLAYRALGSALGGGRRGTGRRGSLPHP